ncbi:hypothetical protein GCM10009550_77810 [Actinocorallia libanotica]|uniref:DDE family transposase n=1 Tax=Actinocorallia libanotica TaxID=46162 RepID=A0ABN1S1R4_9ACTN
MDVLGCVIAVTVSTASTHDNAIGTELLGRVAIDNPWVATARVDARFKNTVAAHGARLGIEVVTVLRDPETRGFVPLPKRWVVEQVYGILMLHRRLVLDRETRTTTPRPGAWPPDHRPAAARGTAAPTGRAHPLRTCRWPGRVRRTGGGLRCSATLKRRVSVRGCRAPSGPIAGGIRSGGLCGGLPASVGGLIGGRLR